MEQVVIDIYVKRVHPDAQIPTYAHGPHEDAGMDLISVERARLYAGVPVLVKTGLVFALPSGIEGQVRSRSGLALKEGIYVLNSPGTLDPGYRGEVGVILCWTGSWGGSLRLYEDEDNQKYKVIEAGSKVAQVVFAAYQPAALWPTEDLDNTSRGAGGFGSTGL
jgi:dUTP pyrophosphatase